MNWDSMRTTKFHAESDGTFTANTIQDVEPNIAENKIDLNAYGSPLTPGKQFSGMRVASIPFNVWEIWMKESNGDLQRDPKVLKKYLNDPDNKYFRTTPTRI